MSLKMRPFAPLRVFVNSTTSRDEIVLFLERQRRWISKNKSKWTHLPTPAEFSGREGDRLYVLGQNLPLRHSITLLPKSFVARSDQEIRYFHSVNDRVERETSDYYDHVKKRVMRYMEVEAEKLIGERAKFCSEMMGLSPKRWRFANQNARWGSCSSRGVIALNRKLIGAPIEVIDSVVIHELAHLVFMNHSQDFWDVVNSFVPNLAECEKWMREHAHVLIRES